MSIPRLELSAAVLLSRLVEFVKNSITFQVDAYFCWTDSTVVLAWLSKHPSKWKTFVANRLAEIHSRNPVASWRHVPSNENPADCASRSLLADELISHPIWWTGPAWLSVDTAPWPPPYSPQSEHPEALMEMPKVASHTVQTSTQWDLATRYSSWNRLIRVTAYIKRFIKNCRAIANRDFSKLSVEEYQEATTFWYKHIQAELFPREIRALLSQSTVLPTSSLLPLNPFLDGNGLLRVGGRLQKAEIPFDQKHPVILASHHLVSLLVSQVHIKMLHSGHLLTLSTLRQEVWILRARNVVRAVIYRCVQCAREKAALPAQLMGSLPTARVSSSTRSFQHCGVDYAGPINIRISSRRGIRPDKAYIALFICLATKAVHLELVGDYSSRTFLNAFSRFCARRGLPQTMYSDNGTNFVGADCELYNAYQQNIRDPELQNKTVSDRITWKFIPPSAPHFGGLWEAGVRSFKHHMRRVIGGHVFTAEEFSTLLCRIEACMNSRPLAPLSYSADDCEVLTPGHFLIGAHLSVPPEPSVCEVNENRLSRWQLIRQLTERWWTSWRNDYLHSLQQRVKWKTCHPSIRIGQVVLLRNSTLPLCKWELGRVIKCHPGPDGLFRVVTIRTERAEYTRPVVKLCFLPVNIEEGVASKPSPTNALEAESKD